MLCACQCGSVRQFRSAAGGALGLAAVRLVPADAGSSVGRCSCCVLVSEDQFGSLIKQRAVLFLHQVAEDINEKIVGRFFQPHQSPPAQLQQVDCPGCNGAFQVPAYSASAQCLTCGTVTQLLPPAPASWAGGVIHTPSGQHQQLQQQQQQQQHRTGVQFCSNCGTASLHN